MADKKRLTALIFAALVFFALTASLFVIALETDHDCTGDNCPVCAAINVFRNTLKALGGALAAAGAAVFCLCSGVCAFLLSFAKANGKTPVALKVKLLN